MKAKREMLEAMALEKESTSLLIEELIEKIEKNGFVVSEYSAGSMKEAMLDFKIEFDDVDSKTAATLKMVAEALYGCSYDYTFIYETDKGRIELLEPTSEDIEAAKKILRYDDETAISETQRITYRLYDYRSLKCKQDEYVETVFRKMYDEYVIMNAERNLAKVYIMISRLEDIFNGFNIVDNKLKIDTLGAYRTHRRKNEEYDHIKDKNDICRFDSDLTDIIVDDSNIERLLLDKYVCKTKTEIKNTKVLVTKFIPTPEDIVKSIRVQPRKRKKYLPDDLDVTNLLVKTNGKAYTCLFEDAEEDV